VSTMERYEQIPPHARRVRGLQVAAMLRLEPEQFEAAYGLKFEPVQDNLGDAVAALVELFPSGKQFGVYKHQEAPYPGTELYANVDSPDLHADITDFLSAFELDRGALYDEISARTFAEDRPVSTEPSPPDIPSQDFAISTPPERAAVAVLGGGFAIAVGLITVALAIGPHRVNSYAVILAGLVPAVTAVTLLLLGGLQLRLPTLRRAARVGADRSTTWLAIATLCLLLLSAASLAAGVIQLVRHESGAPAVIAATVGALAEGGALLTRWRLAGTEAVDSRLLALLRRHYPPSAARRAKL
jgi:hypothetical protein